MNDIKAFIQQIKKIVVDTITPILKNYPRIVSASVISINDRLATVRMPYETDASKDFKAYVITSQLVSVGDVVNVAYWSNLSTAVVLSNTSTVGTSGSGTTNYDVLENKPSINGVTLAGNKTSSDINVAPGGYGLGTTPKVLTDSDDLNNLGGRSGWYYWFSPAPANSPRGMGYCTMRVDGGYNLSGYWGTQTVTYGGPDAITYYRHMTDQGGGTWSDWKNAPAPAATSNTYIYVATTGSDTTGDGSSSNPYKTIQKAVDSLPKLLLSQNTIFIASGTYDEYVKIKYFCGGEIIVQGNSSETVNVRALDCLNCTTDITIKGMNITGFGSEGYNNQLMCFKCKNVYLYNITCTNTVSASHYGAIRFERCDNCTLMYVTVSNKAVAIDILASTVYLNFTVTGTNNTTSIRCGSGWGTAGGYCQKGGSSIAGNESKEYGGQIW